MAEYLKVFFDREVQMIEDLHQFPNGDGGIVLVRAPTLLQAINGWAKVVDMDPDELSTHYEGKKTLSVCDQPIQLEVDKTIELGEKYRFLEVEHPEGVVVAFDGRPPKLLHRDPGDAYPQGHGVSLYVVPPK